MNWVECWIRINCKEPDQALRQLPYARLTGESLQRDICALQRYYGWQGMLSHPPRVPQSVAGPRSFYLARRFPIERSVSLRRRVRQAKAISLRRERVAPWWLRLWAFLVLYPTSFRWYWQGAKRLEARRRDALWFEHRSLSRVSPDCEDVAPDLTFDPFAEEAT